MHSMDHRRLFAAVAAGTAALTVFGTVGAGAATKSTKTTKKTTKTTKKPAVTTAPAATSGTTATTAAPATTKAAAGTPKKGGTFVSVDIAAGDPDHIDPALSHVVSAAQVTGSLYDGLVDIDYETGELKPAVAQSWTSNADGTQIVFKLKKGVKFSNGEDVLPSNFKCAWERAAAPSTASEVGYHLDAIKGKKDIDDGKTKLLSGVTADDANLTLTVNLVSPFTSFVANTQHTVFSPTTKAQCAAGNNYEQGVMIGNGPFKMDGPWKHDQEIKLVRNDSYYGGINNHQAYLDGVTFKIMKDTIAAYNLFESGGASASGIPGGRIKEATGKYGDRAATKPTLSIQYYGFNWADPTVGGFANAKLRQAASLCINRDQINTTIFDNTRAIATGVTPPGVPGFKAGLSAISGKPDVAAGKKLIAEWGKPNPSFKLRVNSVSTNLQIAAIIQQNLKDCGIDVDIDPRPSTTYFSELARNNDYQFFRSGWAYDYAGYDNGMYPLFDTETIGESGSNYSKFSNAEFDKLVAQARATTDDAKQASLYQQAEKILLDQAIVVPLVWGKWTYVVSKDVDRFVQGATAFVDYNEVSFK